MIDIKLPWTEGAPSLDVMDGSIALVKDEFRDSAYGWTRELLARASQDMDLNKAREFWGSVKAREASYALFLLARYYWKDDISEITQLAFCRQEHETEVDDLSWDEFEIMEDPESMGDCSWNLDLTEPIEGLSQIRGDLPSLDDLQSIEDKHGAITEGALNDLIRMICRDGSGKHLSLIQIQRIGLKDRKRIRKLLNGEEHALIDLKFIRKCDQCPRKAYGILNLRSFF